MEYVLLAIAIAMAASARGMALRKKDSLAPAEPEAPSEPALQPPLITSAYSDGETDGTVNLGGACIYIKGMNLDTVATVELLDERGASFQRVSASFADDLVTTEAVDMGSAVSYPERGAILVTTAAGTATYAVAYGNH